MQTNCPITTRTLSRKCAGTSGTFSGVVAKTALLIKSGLGWGMLFMMLAVALSGCTTIAPDRAVEPSKQPTDIFDHALFNGVLAEHVNDSGLVDYQRLKADPEALERYYWLVSNYSPDSHPHLFPDSQHQLAYWINAYNAGAIKTVLRYYPISSVLDVKQPGLFFFLSNKSGFFFFQRLTFGGKSTSLYYLENRVIRKRFKDPRIHFALNCASRGCPRLPAEAFSGEGLDQQLDKEAWRFMAEKRNVTIDHETRAIHLSSIFKWYEEDFVDWYRQKFPDRKGGLLSYIALYLPRDKAEVLQRHGKAYTIRYIDYDWMLNDRLNLGTEPLAGTP